MMTSAARQPVLEEEHDHRDVDHQAISQRVGVLPELRFDPQPPRQPAVHLIGDRGGKDDGGRPAVPLVSPRQQHHEDRYEREPRDRQRIWQLRDRGGDCAGTHGTRIVATRLRARKRPCPGARPRDRPRDSHSDRPWSVRKAARIRRMARTLTLPGFVNAHSHGFQRALRGRAAGADFWAWRETMLAEAERQTPHSVGAEYEHVYREQLAAGYTAVGEAHYLGYDEALAAGEAAQAAGIGSCCSTRHTAAEGSTASARNRRPRTSQTSSGWRRRLARGACTPLRARVPAGLAGRDRKLRRIHPAAAPRARLRAAARDRGVRRRAWAAPGRVARRDGLPWAADDGRPRDACR